MADLREATLEDLLSDPVIMAVMASDGVRADDIRQLMKQVGIRSRMRFRREPPAPLVAAQ